MTGMLRRLGTLCALSSMFVACDGAGATVDPGMRPLCGTWTADSGANERWEIDGDNLIGKAFNGEEHEDIALLAGDQGHVYSVQPGGGPTTEFRPIDPSAARFSVQVPPGAKVWVWANYDHDFPQEIHYALLANEGRLEATIVGPGEGGEAASMAWTMTRTASCVIVS